MLLRVARPRHARAAQQPSCTERLVRWRLWHCAAARPHRRCFALMALVRVAVHVSAPRCKPLRHGSVAGCHTGRSQLHRAAVAHSPQAHHGWHSERPSACAIKQRRLLAGKSGTRQHDCTHRGSWPPGLARRLCGCVVRARLRLSTARPAALRDGGVARVLRRTMRREGREGRGGGRHRGKSTKLRGYSGPSRPGWWS